MGIKEIIGNFFQGNSERKARLKEMIDERRLQKMADDRVKPSDEREWERFHEENRQRKIKEDLIAFRKQRQDEFNQGTLLNQKNIFNNHNSILKQPNIFAGKGNLLNGGNLFLK